MGGIGFSLHLNESHSFEFDVGVGLCTNTKVELVGIWALLLTTQMMGIPSLKVFGDSSVIINWVKGKSTLSPPELHYWCRETRKLCTHFLALSFNHIYREHNQQADRLSKVALTLAPGSSTYSEFLDGHLTISTVNIINKLTVSLKLLSLWFRVLAHTMNFLRVN